MGRDCAFTRSLTSRNTLMIWIERELRREPFAKGVFVRADRFGFFALSPPYAKRDETLSSNFLLQEDGTFAINRSPVLKYSLADLLIPLSLYPFIVITAEANCWYQRFSLESATQRRQVGENQENRFRHKVQSSLLQVLVHFESARPRQSDAIKTIFTAGNQHHRHLK